MYCMQSREHVQSKKIAKIDATRPSQGFPSQILTYLSLWLYYVL